MSMFVDYATKADLAEYLGISEDDLPSEANTYIKRASEMVCIAMRKNFNKNNTQHLEMAKLAVCAQCKEWVDRGSMTVTDGNIASYSIGEISVTYATNNNNSDISSKSNVLNSDAKRYLNYKHLLYKG